MRNIKWFMINGKTTKPLTSTDYFQVHAVSADVERERDREAYEKIY